MLKKILFISTIFIFWVTIFSFFTSIQAQANPFDIQFPIAELGNCGSMDECKTYCDDAVNIGACTAFAEKQGLIAPKEAQKVRAIAEKIGPGGCKNARECDNYCRTPEHGEECVSYAVKEGFISEEEADNMLELMGERNKKSTPPRGINHTPSRGPKEPEFDKEKAKDLIGTIGGPGGCSTFDECDKFCSDLKNNDTCMAYAVEHKLMKTEDAEKLKKLMTIEGPGGCRGRECEFYCEEPGHESECMEFAVSQGFMSKEEFEEAKKFLDASKEGGPGGCQGRECERYCNDPAHGDECFNFAKEHNLLPKEELHRIEKFKDIRSNLEAKGGPGGCRGEGECRDYCSDATHFEECAAFAVNAGVVDLDKAKDVLKQFVEIEEFRPQGFGRPGENFGPPRDFIPQGGSFESNNDFGRFGPPPEFEENFEDRFKQFGQFRGDFEHMPMPPEFKGDLQNGFNPPQGFEGGFHQPDEFPGNGEFRPDMEFPIQGEFEGFMPPSNFMSPNNMEGSYVRPPDSGFAYPQGDFVQPNSYTPPIDQTMLLPTILFPLLPLLNILF